MPYKDQEAKREADKERLRTKRGATNGGDIVGGDKYPDGTKTLLFPPSKFLSPEQDRLVQENVVNTMKAMTGSRLQSFRGLSNAFTPNRVKNPEIPEPLKGTPWIEDIAEFVDSASEEIDATK